VACALKAWENAPEIKAQFYNHAIYTFLPPTTVDMSSHKRKDVAKRIARIHGHMHGIMEMVDEGRSYSEIVQQISAVKAALDSTLQVIVEDLVEDCVARNGKKDLEMNETLLEIKLVANRLA
jgi:DNA-binding FrmR family transcriptional regulator